MEINVEKNQALENLEKHCKTALRTTHHFFNHICEATHTKISTFLALYSFSQTICSTHNLAKILNTISSTGRWMHWFTKICILTILGSVPVKFLNNFSDRQKHNSHCLARVFRNQSYQGTSDNLPKHTCKSRPGHCNES